MHIRPAFRADVPAVLAISNRAARHTPANFATEPESCDDWLKAFDTEAARCPWFVAVDPDDAIVGFAKASPWKGRCAYQYSVEITVYVHPDHHRRGIGRALYEALFPAIEALGYRTLIAGITLPNDASVALHERMGMRQVARFERVGWKLDAWHDVGYWQLNLGGSEPPT
ncbi:MAG: GNAT family N-acetyltransferase [Planctomycetota bacterium]|jgi:phosphinothricin acetyltransferase